MPDPLNDPAFAGRLAKLLPMLGSGQPEEADVARRKLIEHLGSQGLSLTDLAARLQRQMALTAPAPNGRPRDTDRQVQTLRALLAETSADLVQSQGTVRELQRAVDRLALLSKQYKAARDRAMRLAVAASVGGGLVAISVAAPWFAGGVAGPELSGRSSLPITMETGDEAARGALRPPGPGEAAASAAVQDLAIRFEPDEGAGVRAYLNRGTPVVIMRRVRTANQTWLFVRSASGMGWARSGDILR